MIYKLINYKNNLKINNIQIEKKYNRLTIYKLETQN